MLTPGSCRARRLQVKNTYSTNKYLMACGNSCSNAESCAHAFGQVGVMAACWHQ